MIAPIKEPKNGASQINVPSVKPLCLKPTMVINTRGLKSRAGFIALLCIPPNARAIPINKIAEANALAKPVVSRAHFLIINKMPNIKIAVAIISATNPTNKLSGNDGKGRKYSMANF